MSNIVPVQKVVDLTVVKTEADTEHSTLTAMLSELKEIKLETEEDLEAAAEGIRYFKEVWTKYEEKRTLLTKPLNESLRAANNVYRAVLDTAKQGEKLLKDMLAAHLREKEERNKLALAAAAAASTPEEAVVAFTEMKVVEAPKGIGIRKVWKFEIINAGLVPYEYLTPDLDKIAEACPGPIPGVRFYEEDSVSARKR